MFFLFLGVLGIGIRLNIAKENLIWGALGGILSMSVLNSLSSHIPYPATVFFTAFSGSVFSEILARIKKTPVSVFRPLSIVPILPGKAVYDAIKLAIHEDTHLFLENSISILYTTLSMALGIIAVKTIEIIFSKIFNSFSKKHK